jgi:NADPH-dependent 2,4-dienoyl-CoA reductase/sulfur reductase-like enzyme
MSKQVRKQFDVLVVGSGPAGLAAAVCAAEYGRQVGIVDDNPGLGGQVWRGRLNKVGVAAASWVDRLRASGVEVLSSTRVFHQPEAGILQAEAAENLCELSYEKLVLATGARERFLPFPGWTLPNVMGAGGLQALVKSGLPIAGKRVVVAGSGPLLLAVAVYLREHGAKIPIICEQASWTSLARFGIALLGQPQKIRQGFSLRTQLSGIPFATNSWPTSAAGEEKLDAVVIRRNQKSEKIACDYLACGFHLLPNTELPALLGCRIDEGFVLVDDTQQTTVAGIFCAGEPTGIGGLELALVEGQIAGLVAAGQGDRAKRLFRKRDKLNKFAQTLERTFGLRYELKGLPQPETLVCRCEDVTYNRLKRYTSWRAAKLQTRCGMGPCQGRVCGPVTEFLFDWHPDSIRPPIFPTRFENLGAVPSQPAETDAKSHSRRVSEPAKE